MHTPCPAGSVGFSVNALGSVGYGLGWQTKDQTNVENSTILEKLWKTVINEMPVYHRDIGRAVDA